MFHNHAEGTDNPHRALPYGLVDNEPAPQPGVYADPRVAKCHKGEPTPFAGHAPWFRRRPYFLPRYYSSFYPRHYTRYYNLEPDYTYIPVPVAQQQHSDNGQAQPCGCVEPKTVLALGGLLLLAWMLR